MRTTTVNRSASAPIVATLGLHTGPLPSCKDRPPRLSVAFATGREMPLDPMGVEHETTRGQSVQLAVGGEAAVGMASPDRSAACFRDALRSGSCYGVQQGNRRWYGRRK